MHLPKAFHSSQLFIALSLLGAKAQGQAPFSLRYAGASFSDIGIAANGDLLVSSGKLAAIYPSVVRFSGTGDVLWSRRASDQESFRGAPIEASDGDLVLTTYRDNALGRACPAFVLLDANGDLVEAKYHQVDTLDLAVLDIERNSAGDLAVLNFDQPSSSFTLLLADERGDAPSARTFPLATSGALYAGLTPGNNGDLIMYCGSSSVNSVISKIAANGTVDWSSQLIIDGSDDNRTYDAVVLPNGNIVLAIETLFNSVNGEIGLVMMDPQGAVLWCKLLVHADRDLGDVILTALPDGDFLLELILLSTVPYDNSVLLRLNGNGDPLWQIAPDPALAAFTTAALDADRIYRCGLSSPNYQAIALMDLAALPSPCSEVDSAAVIDVVATATPFVFSTTVPSITTVAFTPFFDTIAYTPSPLCFSTGNVGLEEVGRKVFLFPMPLEDGTVRIGGAAPGERWDLTIYNVLGVALLQGVAESELPLDLSGLSCGEYVLDLKGRNGRHRLRLTR
ncbi:MAG: hypothetical protein KA352_16820 [Flavobacteriales bacterium]|nr:hypothetical protein [Flavobacteriales bacterium]